MSDAAATRFGISESELLAPLVTWLRRRGQLRQGAMIAEEFPWYGRRIDLAVVTKSGITSAYELKLAHNRRAIEQSYLNGVAFDRSFLVTATKPAPINFVQAESIGLGIIHVSPVTQKFSILLQPRPAVLDPVVRAKLRLAIKRRGGAIDV